jgi:hypothetical protein
MDAALSGRLHPHCSRLLRAVKQVVRATSSPPPPPPAAPSNVQLTNPPPDPTCVSVFAVSWWALLPTRRKCAPARGKHACRLTDRY